MLILSRRPGETITIGPNAEIKLTLLDVNGKQAKVGIEAPKAVPVHRQEIYLKIQQEQQLQDSEQD
ncbi:MAG: carbon storage regulator CsrA [Gammaproteobacteria bacterium]|nr:carbon storage regulator CsrA [Gammaproteobacteria bacterium]